MGDPVTMAVVGGSVGAMMNKKDPLKGAMLGAMGGYGGATLLPTLGAGTAATGGMTGTNVAGGVAPGAFGAPAANAAVTNAAPSMSTIFANPTSAIGGKSALATAGPSTGMIPSSLYQPTFMEKVSGGLDSIGQFTKDYPVASQMAFMTGQSLLQQQQPQLQFPGLMRGNPAQVQMPQYQVGVPQISLI
jgi:hypothetical protein